MTKRILIKPLAMMVGMSLLTACAGHQHKAEMESEREKQLDARSKLIEKQAAELAAEQQQLEAKYESMKESELLPPNAKPGECYARVWVEPEFRTVTETVQVKDGSEVIEIIPAKFETVTERILVQDADYRIEVVPATYKTVTERKLVKEGFQTWRIDPAPNAVPASPALLAAVRDSGINLDAATPGTCYHEHFIPPQAGHDRETVLVKEGYDVISVTEPEYRWVEKRILIQEASTQKRVVPAVYEQVTERVVDVAAHTVWKKGSGPIQKIDEATGEIMCLVEVPATYKTITKDVLVSPARTEEVKVPAVYDTVRVRELVKGSEEVVTTVDEVYDEIDIIKRPPNAEFVWHEVHNMDHPKSTRTGNRVCLTETPPVYETVSKTVVDTPATTRRVEIPAVYDTVQITKLVEDVNEARTVVEEEFQTVTSQELVNEGHMEWRSILCKTNMTKSTISDIQRALMQRGYNPGPIDGVIGHETMRAVNAFQRANDLPTDKYINMETVEELGVSL